MKKISLVASLVLLMCMMFGGQAFAGPEGVYVIKESSQMGEMESTVAINADGTGYVEGMMGKTEFTKAKIDGNKFAFSMTATSPMGDMKMDYKGTVDGDNISGTSSGMMGDTPFTGQRKK
jgi:hypothetical protein